MSVETASERKRKRIVEHAISGFRNAKEAITFGNTVNSVIQGRVKEFIKFKQQIGSPDTTLAITESYTGETILKTIFLDVPDQNTAVFICDTLKVVADKHKDVHDNALHVMDEIVREKPQPQVMGYDLSKLSFQY